MSIVPKRTIDELITIHRLHGSNLREIFVEGITDKHVIDDALKSRGINHVGIYDINTVDVPTDSVIALGFSDGNRGRVIALATLLEGHAEVNEICCIADADTDYVRGCSYSTTLLLYTDATSLEAYALDPSVISRFLRSTPGFPKDVPTVLAEVGAFLSEIFIRRAACEELGFPASFKHDLTESLSFNKKTHVVSVRTEHYENRMFGDLPHITWVEPLRQKISELKRTLPTDPRKYVHGHDLQRALGWYIRSHCGFGEINAATISKMFLCLLDTSYLTQQPMFIELIRRMN